MNGQQMNGQQMNGQQMKKSIGFGLLWVGLIGYAFIVAPPDQPDTWTLIQHLSTGQLAGINPLIVTLFNVMGVLPMIYASVLVFDGRGQRLPAWPFMVGAFAIGAFALLPYLALRRPNPTFDGDRNGWLRWIDSHWNGLAIALLSAGLLGYGAIAGDFSDFVQQWQTSRFIHVMSLDFCLLCLLFPSLLGDDMARRQWVNPLVFWAVSLVPLLGPAVYLAIRPPLPSQSVNPASPASSASQPVS
ncbi:MAG TPA: DUF2834 domain-containing protein [Chroococcidiopsis sp.]